ncbi:hypothetical protein [Bradyrhizobium sp. BR 1432]
MNKLFSRIDEIELNELAAVIVELSRPMTRSPLLSQAWWAFIFS